VSVYNKICHDETNVTLAKVHCPVDYNTKNENENYATHLVGCSPAEL
jgi:hypothetical protein